MIFIKFSRTNTELWDVNSFESQTIGPVISNEYWQVELFPVDIGFCSRN